MSLYRLGSDSTFCSIALLVQANNPVDSMSFLLNFLLNLSKVWYSYELHCIAVCKDMLLNNKKKISKNANSALYHDISLSQNEIESVHIVHSMFKNMNISNSGATTLVNILCSDKTLTPEMRHSLVDLYHRYTRLTELADARTDFHQDIIKTNLDEVKLQLQLYLMKLMPISNEYVEHDMAELQLELDKQLRKRDMLNLSQNIINEMYMEPQEQIMLDRLAIESTQHKSEPTKSKAKSKKPVVALPV